MIASVRVRLLRAHDQGPVGAVIAVRPPQADRLIAEGLAELAAQMPPPPIDVVAAPEPQTATTAPSAPRPRRRKR